MMKAYNYRELEELVKICPQCGESNIQHLLNGNRCDFIDKSHSKILLAKFWSHLNGSEDKFDLIMSSPKLLSALERLVIIAVKWGLHNPLIVPTTVKLEITNKCNLKCKHCIANSGMVNKDELSFDEICTLLTQCKKLGIKNIGLLGGEPLTRNDIFEIIEFATNLGFNITLSTNATLVNMDLAKKIASTAIKNISVSLDGMKDEHDLFRGINGAFIRTSEGIQMLKKAGLKVSVITVITKVNYNRVPDVVEYCIHLGVDKFSLNDLHPSGRGSEIRELCIENEQYKQLSETISNLREKYADIIDIAWAGAGNNLKVKDSEQGPYILSRCGAGLTEITISSEGTIRPCPFLCKTHENIRNRTLEEIWFNSDELKKYQNRFDLQGNCGSCDYQLSCSGCRARAESYSGKLNSTDPRCLKYI